MNMTNPEGVSVSRRAVVTSAAGLGLAMLTGCSEQGSLASSELELVGSLPAHIQRALPQAMSRAIDIAPEEAPFGAVLLNALSGDLVAEAGNRTVTGDPSAHAEVDVLRDAGTRGFDLTQTFLVTTAESCVMCAACAVWAGVRGVVYGTPVSFLAEAGWNQFTLTQPQIVSAGWLRMAVVGNYMREVTDPLYASGPGR